MTLRTASYGGGVQSTAMLVLAAQGEINYPIFLFANTGDDSENPKSLVYVREVAMPYAAAHGIELHELHRTRRDGTQETLYGRCIVHDVMDALCGCHACGNECRASELVWDGERRVWCCPACGSDEVDVIAEGGEW